MFGLVSQRGQPGGHGDGPNLTGRRPRGNAPSSNGQKNTPNRRARTVSAGR